MYELPDPLIMYKGTQDDLPMAHHPSSLLRLMENVRFQTVAISLTGLELQLL